MSTAKRDLTVQPLDLLKGALIVAVFAAFANWLKKSPNLRDLKVTNHGPATIPEVNKSEKKDLAIWLMTDNISVTSRVLGNDRPLASFVDESAHVITAVVTPDLFPPQDKTLKIQVIDKPTGRHSNIVEIAP